MDASMIGPRIGKGSRIVHEYGTDAVIKLACPTKRSLTVQNVAEGRAWDRVRNTPAARLFAPVLAYDPAGAWLIMSRVETCDPYQGDHRAEAMEMQTRQYGLLVDDIDSDNLGTMNDRTVILDYGIWNDSHVWDETGDYCKACRYCDGMVF